MRGRVTFMLLGRWVWLRKQVQQHLVAAWHVAAAVAFRAVIGGFLVSIVVGMLAIPVLLLQTAGWLRHGFWVKLSVRTFYPRIADTRWIGLNAVVNRVAEAELAAAIVLMAAVLFGLSLLAGLVFSWLPDIKDLPSTREQEKRARARDEADDQARRLAADVEEWVRTNPERDPLTGKINSPATETFERRGPKDT